MSLAWFRPAVPALGIDDLGAVIAGVARGRSVHVVDERGAHDFVWQWARGAFELCVYELDDTPAHAYIWPYLLRYPGVLALRSSTLHDGRALSLIHQRRDTDYAAEIAFAGGARRAEPPWHLLRGAWPLWKVPVLASRLTVVADDALAGAIAQACPDARVVRTPTGVPDPCSDHPSDVGAASAGTLRVLVCDDGSPGAIDRAVDRARHAGAAIDLARDAGSPERILGADVIVATRWPGQGRPLTAALLGAAAGKAVLVTETESTAAWPSLDPQTWQPRSVATGTAPVDAPIAISIDPRDEEHSLMLALVRLAGDAPMRRELGAAARAWWAAHATVAHAVAAWQTVLDEALSLAPAPRPDGWPAHLDNDGSRRAAAILAPFGIESPFGDLS